jgi:hypothetical protein
MKVSNNQLAEYITLYETTYGEKLEPTRALVQLNKLISLVMYMLFPESTIDTVEKELKEEYTEVAAHKV